MRIVLSGGHLTPAYSFAEKSLVKGDQLLYLVARGVNSIEAKEMNELGVTSFSIRPVKFNRNKKVQSLLKFPLIIIPIIESIRHLRSWKADVVVLFGSYNAVPIAFAAKLLGLPIVLHEQTIHGGLANQIVKHLATSCALSYKTSLPFFPKNKSHITGNLIRQIFWQPGSLFSITLPTNKPILYVTGGNQGSAAILKAVSMLESELSKRYQLIIQCGDVTWVTESNQTSRVLVQKWFSPKDTAFIMNHARIIISRGGANTIAEIMVVGTPSIIIPLPNTSQDEQTHNAHTVAQSGAGIMLTQAELTPGSLLHAISIIETNYEGYYAKAKHLKSLQNPNAAQELYDLVHKATRR